MIRILHITPDSKFFDFVIKKWEENEDFENKAIFLTNDRDYKFKYIKKIEKIEILWNSKMIKRRLSSGDYDVAFFHSLPEGLYRYLYYIPHNKIVIWWGWGFDLYQCKTGMPPLINLDLYKPLTLKYIKRFPKIKEIWLNLFYYLIKPIRIKWRKYAISRIDYFQPVVRGEYPMMCNVKNFRAKEFYPKTVGKAYDKESLKDNKGNILLGNSATPTNNHLDVLRIIRKYKQDGQKIIIPLNYGQEKYKTWLTPYLKNPDIMTLTDFLPSDKYFELVENCSYAVFGTIRQQALGNITHALRKGIKVFLYQDIVVYKTLKDSGYAVYAIEDMSEDSLLIPLSKEEMLQNINASQKEIARRQATYETDLCEIKQSLGMNL